MERLDYGLIDVLLAADDTDQTGMTFEGYGAVFNNLDFYGDTIAPGAFKDTLREAKRSGTWPAMLAQHGGGFFGGGAEDLMPIGLWTELAEDDKGLHVTGTLADTPRGREAYGLLKMTPRPALNGLSIGFRAKEFSLGTKPDEPRRTLKKIDLVEISLVTFPANPKARVTSVKSLQIRDIERWLMQDAGLSRSEARIAINSGFKTLLAMQDAGQEDEDEDATLAAHMAWLSQFKTTLV